MTPLERYRGCPVNVRDAILAEWPAWLSPDSSTWGVREQTWLSDAIERHTGFTEADPQLVAHAMDRIATAASEADLNHDQIMAVAGWCGAQIDTLDGLELLLLHVKRVGQDLRVIPDAVNDSPGMDGAVTAWLVEETGAGSDHAHARAVTDASIDDPGEWRAVVTIIHPAGHTYVGSPFTIVGTAAHTIARHANRAAKTNTGAMKP